MARLCSAHCKDILGHRIEGVPTDNQRGEDQDLVLESSFKLSGKITVTYNMNMYPSFRVSILNCYNLELIYQVRNLPKNRCKVKNDENDQSYS